jgi:hypothetical protein
MLPCKEADENKLSEIKAADEGNNLLWIRFKYLIHHL